MPFDLERVLALARGLPAPRPFRSEAERRAGDDIADQLERLGLRVERPESPAYRGQALAFLAFLIFWCWLGVAGTMPGTPLPVRAFLFGLILLAMNGASRIAARRSRSGDLSKPSRHVLGALPTGEDAPVRVILATLLRSPPSRRVNTLLTIVLILFVALGVVPMVPWMGGLIRTRPSVGRVLLFGQWVSLFFLILGPKGEATRPVSGDNRTGLAMLVELARTWPKGLGRRAETLFVASPGALARTLPSILREPKPTLLILLDSPGVGRDLIVLGRGPAARLSEAAAQDLWIPHRWVRSSALDRHLPRALRRAGLVSVGLSGVHGDRPVDPALLAATAQLVTEVAFRWAKQAADPAQGASPARSSQNPG